MATFIIIKAHVVSNNPTICKQTHTLLAQEFIKYAIQGKQREQKEKELTKHKPKSALVFLPPVKSIADA